MSISMESLTSTSPKLPPPPPPPPPPASPLHEYQTEAARSPEANQLQIVTVPPSHEEKNDNQYDYRFQRTDQWMPVYSWLESLDTDELVKSNDILDWLTANPEIREQLSSRHSKYHLMHYIKKCHLKILKKKGKNKGVQVWSRVDSEYGEKNVDTKPPASVSSMGNTLSSMPEDQEMYKTKHKEAFEKYEILVEFEKQLLAMFPPRS